MHEFRMPSLGADMDEGRIVDWKIQPGQHVVKGDIVAVVDTDKAEIDVEVFDSGTVEAIMVQEGQRVPVGTVLATLRDDNEADETAAPGAPPVPASTSPGSAVPSPPSRGRPSAPPPAVVTATEPANASPIVRRLARHLGVDVAAVRGTGPGGHITRADVEAAGEPAAPGPVPATANATVESAPRQSAMRLAIGALMSRSKREIPHYYVGTQIDMGDALAWLAARNESRPIPERILPAVLLLKATALAARRLPQFNGFWIDDRFVAHERVHLGVAIALREGGLVAPAIHDADTLELDELMAALRDLVGRVRAGRLRASEMSDPTITVTNLGEQSAETVYGVIYPPQVALIGFGAIVERPWARDGMLGVRPVVGATVAADHRATDGRDGSRLLQTLDRLLRDPEQL